MKTLLEKLRDQNIKISLNDDDNIEVVSSLKEIPSNLLLEIKTNKNDIINFLKSYRTESFFKIPVAKKADVYAVSSAQKSLWVLSQYENSSIAYNIPSNYSIEISNLNFFEKAIETVIGRHEILRTIFKSTENGEIKQIILSQNEFNFKIEYKDFRQEKNFDEKVASYIASDAHKPFDLAKGPLFRIALFQISEQKIVFYFNMHHIISDGWSMEVLKNEVYSLYKSYESNTIVNLPPLRIQYKDYAEWELSQILSGQMQEHKSYWLNHLAGELPILNLPTSKIRPRTKTYNGRGLGSIISSEQGQLLKKLVQAENCSLFIGLTAVLKILLYKYTNQKDIIVGFPMASRDHIDLKNQIGFYIKTLALRNQLSEEDEFLTFLRKLKTNTLSAFQHQDYPFFKLIEDLNLSRDLSRSPVFDVSVSFHDFSNNDEIVENEQRSVKDFGPVSCKNDLEFHFKTSGNDSLFFSVNYNTDVYDSDIVTRFIYHFKQLLENILINPNEKIKRLNSLTTQERIELLINFNNTAVFTAQEQTLNLLFAHQVVKTPDVTALISDNLSLTYKDLDSISNQLAHCLRDTYGISLGDMIGVQLHRSAWSVISILAIMKAGGVYVPIDMDFPDKRKSFIVEDTQLKLLVTETAFVFDIGFYNGTTFAIDVEFIPEEFSSQPLAEILTGNDLAYVIYTSGSTGQPKGVMIEHNGISNTILSQIEHFNIRSCERSLQFASLSFDASIADIFVTLLSGTSLYIVNEATRRDVRLFEHYIVSNKIDIATLPPAYLKLMSVESLKGLKVLITAGEPPIYDKVVSFLKYGTYINAYGPTESSICSTLFKIEKGSDFISSSIPIGIPIANTQIYIVDEYLGLQPKGVAGEICVAGLGLAKGYLNLPDLTSDKFIDNPYNPGQRLYKTGDIGRWLSDGNIEYLGRKDDQLKIRGFRIELGEIENVILSYTEKINQVVLTVKESNSDKSLIAYYISDAIVDKSDLRMFLLERLPDYMVPAFYVQLESFMLTINGKIDKKALPEFDKGDRIQIEYVAPNTPEELILIEIISKILKFDSISIKDDFYNLGGDSVKSIQVMSLLTQAGYTLEIEDLLNVRIIEELAILLKPIVSKIEKTEAEKTELDGHITVERSYDRNWKEGDSIEISPNQDHFYKFDFNQVVFNFELSSFNELTFETQFRLAISDFPHLSVRFYKEDNKVIQQLISSDDLKIDLKIRNIDLEVNKKVNPEIVAFFSRKYDLFDGEHTRVLVISNKSDKNNATVIIGIHHLLADAYTSKMLSNEFRNLLENPEYELDFIPHFNYMNWQKNFLTSKEGLKKRDFWLQSLQQVHLAKDNKVKKENEFSEVIIQSVFISGAEFQAIRSTEAKLNIPMSGLLSALYQLILRNVDVKGKSLFGLLVDGREQYIEGMDLSKILGVLNNVLPLTYMVSNSEFDKEYITETYIKYVNARLYQQIPYEIIRSDFREKSGIDIRENLIGVFNFLMEERPFVIEDIKKSEAQKDSIEGSFGISMVCNLYPNGLKINLSCVSGIYNERKDILSLDRILEKLIKFKS